MPGAKTWEQHLSRRRMAFRGSCSRAQKVVDSVEDLLEGVPMKALQAKRLQSKAQEAYEAARARAST